MCSYFRTASKCTSIMILLNSVADLSKCGPCHAIAPKYEALSKQHTNVNFFKCNVDTAKDVAAKYRISAMPTFIFIKSGQVIETIKGANASAIENALGKHSGGGSFSGKGQTLGSASGSTSSANDSFNSHLYIGMALLALYTGLWYYNVKY
ncbi:thioredoxin-domain-containing protein [Wallemia mellicola CBS 633.66]|uniref:Thioredoxin-domain-containing protein n=1 Tax=Wallemia mellicola (strain ATCC MYA-4683 / CBS 633.66) TaxID=671144 RepID=I4Y816_WALMC|nr:thioredoxin-domain-containing protein [Wallemia mellicola CBS 633.66]EIM20108.1 thioredoxin-domain-containing protein [Wallemia mellicola CBS 633.66]|eukprot:XP_006959829.1 thioredoxin-domain-containing protein [Wallemia mellicola CBS 633.66]